MLHKYRDEVLGPMDATHQDLCKFRNRLDPNYLKIRNAVQELMALTAPSKLSDFLGIRK